MAAQIELIEKDIASLGSVDGPGPAAGPWLPAKIRTTIPPEAMASDLWQSGLAALQSAQQQLEDLWRQALPQPEAVPPSTAAAEAEQQQQPGEVDADEDMEEAQMDDLVNSIASTFEAQPNEECKKKARQVIKDSISKGKKAKPAATKRG